MENHKYLPEGRLIHTHENISSLASTETINRALEEKQVLEGIALKCGPDLTLTVDLGGHTGFIAKNEAAIGTDDGATRDIAIISRVGKPVAFQILQADADTFVLSRRQLQEAAKRYFLSTLKLGDVIPVTITHMEPFGAFVDMGCGLTALISIENISTARIAHPSDRFATGDETWAVVQNIEEETGRFSLSHKELLGTWAENAAAFTQGETVFGVVRSIKPYGAFVELSPNLSGLTEPYPDLKEGDFVSVYIKAILPEKRKIKLIVISKLDALPPAPKMRHYITEGNVADWTY